MFKISILKDSQVTNQASFPSLEEGQEWLARHEGMGTFGQKATTIQREIELSPAVINEDGTELIPAVSETQTQEIPGYTVVFTDLTAKIEQEKINAEALKFLADTDHKVIRHIGQQALGLATSLTAQEYFELEQQRQQAREAIRK